jgi:hypothetical protein
METWRCSCPRTLISPNLTCNFLFQFRESIETDGTSFIGGIPGIDPFIVTLGSVGFARFAVQVVSPLPPLSAFH